MHSFFSAKYFLVSIIISSLGHGIFSHVFNAFFRLKIFFEALSSVIPFSSCLQSFPASGSFLMGQFFASDGQSIGVSASAPVLPMDIQGWFPLGLMCFILLFKGLSRVFSSTTIKKHQFFTSRGQSIRASASASVLPVNIQGWFPLGLNSLIS